MATLTERRVPGELRPGDTVGRWTLIRCLGRRPSKTGMSSAMIWEARCACGHEGPLRMNNAVKYEREGGGCERCRWQRLTGQTHRAPGRKIDENSQASIARRLGLSESAICTRLRRGWTWEEATTTQAGDLPPRLLALKLAGERGPGRIRNRKTTKQYRYTEAAKRMGITLDGIRKRLARDWTEEEALTTPRGMVPVRLLQHYRDTSEVRQAIRNGEQVLVRDAGVAPLNYEAMVARFRQLGGVTV